MQAQAVASFQLFHSTSLIGTASSGSREWPWNSRRIPHVASCLQASPCILRDLPLPPYDEAHSACVRSFNKLGMPKFDHFLIDVEAPVNTAVDLINDVNGIIDGLKDAVAMVVGAYKVDIQIGVDHDTVLLAIVKAADGAYPTPEEVDPWELFALRSCDAKLCRASPVHVPVEPGRP
jgi:hypothetical protein